ncbi:hypothetical protein [Endozoicomonas numazuensis]|uniref:Uncharacterized protein n=1 Tax=Endozoicomonas numazuensis TaxID=1137799 RepID=A0A081N3W0_9GAMM|nr:hypothetical protein [Endozoicomonas numazuensis]KEQ13133.1 hypothetical protein GZ78_26660 [Endozoicomonas numazuensis]
MAARYIWILSLLSLFFSSAVSGSKLLKKRPEVGIAIVAEHQQLHTLFFTHQHLLKVGQCFKHPASESDWRKEYALSCSETVSKIAKAWTFLISQLELLVTHNKRPLLSVTLVDSLFKQLTGYDRKDPQFHPIATTGNLLPVKDVAVIQDHKKLYQWLTEIAPNLSPEPYAFVCLEREIVSIMPASEIEKSVDDVAARQRSLHIMMRKLKITLKISAADDGMVSPEEDLFNKHLAVKLAERLEENPLLNTCQYRDEYPDFL